MSALSEVEVAAVDLPEDQTADVPMRQPASRALRLVRPPETAGTSATCGPGERRAGPRSSSIRVAAWTPGADAVLTPSAIISPRPGVTAAPAPLRLTRRGRVVVAIIVAAVIAGVALALGIAIAGAADLAGSGRPGVGHQGMHEIVVRSGQTLWSIASAAEPSADPRLVVRQIMAANEMSTADVAAGQLLWVPR